MMMMMMMMMLSAKYLFVHAPTTPLIGQTAPLLSLTVSCTSYCMILSNEAVLMLIGFIGIASIVVYAISENYGDTVDAITFLGNAKQRSLSETVQILDIQVQENTVYAIIANHSFDAVTFTQFWDADGNDISQMCQDRNGTFDVVPLTILPSDTAHILCTFPGVPSGIILLTENYNMVHISA